MDCGLRTAYCGLGIKHGQGKNEDSGLSIKHGLGIKFGLRIMYIKTALER